MRTGVRTFVPSSAPYVLAVVLVLLVPGRPPRGSQVSGLVSARGWCRPHGLQAAIRPCLMKQPHGTYAKSSSAAQH